MSKHGLLTKWVHLVIAAVIATPIALTAFGAGGVAHAADTVVAVDDAGADDEPGQKDLNALSVNYGDPGADHIAVTWNWDDTATSGANTRDGCSLFDTDGDGFANYSLCLTVNADDTTAQSLFVCTADSRADRCGGPSEILTFASTITFAEPVDSDPFGPTGSDSDPSHAQNNDCSAFNECITVDGVASADIDLADFGDPTVAKLINVCSYPSREPNSDPSDCVFEPNNGFLTIVKTVDDSTTDAFVFNASAAGSNGVATWTINGAGTVALISYPPTTTLDLNEVIPDAWNLASKSCLIQTQNPTSTGTQTATGIDNFEIRSGLETICTFNNSKKQAGVTLQKVWVDGKSGDTAALTLSRTGVTDNATSTAPDAPGPDNSANLQVFAGQTVSLSEDLGAAGANYTTTFACTGNSNQPTVDPGNRSATLAISAADAQNPIVCTFTNTRKGVDLTVSKVWQNAEIGDAVSITTTGAANNVNFAPSAGTANETDTTPPPPYRVFAGETLSFSEVFTTGSPAAYTTTFDCTGAADTNESDGVTISPSDTAITCTYTNARRPVQVVVAKQLSPANDAGLFDLSINGVTKVTDGGNGATSAASPVTVFTGDSVSVAETAGTGTLLANYTSSLACDNGITLDPNNGTSGSFDVPPSLATNTTITCTFTNTRKQATFALNKAWGDADAGEVVSLIASATVPAPIGTPIAAQSTAPTNSGGSMTVYSGQTISLSEAFNVPANGDNYTTSLSCVDGQGQPFTSGLTVGALNRSATLVVGSSPVDVTCTFTNTLKAGGVIVQKVWVDGRASDEAHLTASVGGGGAVEDTSVAPSAPVINPGDETLDNVVAIAAFAGDTVDFSESLGAAADLYTTEWSCTDAAGTSGDGTSGAVTITPADVGQNPVVCTITNTRKSATIQLVKDWDDSPETDDEVRLEIGTGGVNTALNGADGTPDDFATAQVLVGQSYPISETFTSGDAANYNSSWSCNNADGSEGPGLSGAVAIGADDADATVVCTFLNARKTMTLELQKAWVNGHDGDTAELVIDGINDDSAASTATSTLGTVTDTTNVVTVTAFAGETLTLSEIVDPGANYTSSLDCGAHAIVYTAGARTGTIAITPADELSTVTCTYTNTRKSATLTVEKTWNDPVGDATVTLAASGGLSAGLTGTTTSTSPNDLVAPNAPTMTIFAGETINVSETFADAGAAGMFSTTLSCATLSTVDAVVSGSVVVGSDPQDTTCTFHNVRESTTLTLRKVWTNGAQDDNVVLSVDGTSPVATATAVVPAGGDGLSAATASATVYAGETVLLTEMFDADNVGTYDITNFICDDGNPDPWSPGDNGLALELENSGDVADAITCTVTNVRKASTLTLVKVWVDPASGPAAVTLDAAGDDVYAADSATIVSTSPTAQSITIDVLSGETATVSEAFDTAGGKLGAENYDTTLLCTGGSPQLGVYQDSVVIADDPAPITCTFTNTRKSNTLILQKAWMTPVNGDEVTLSIDGTTSDTSNSVVAPATTETASITVYAGETVTISESIDPANVATYDVRSVSCTAGVVDWSQSETDTDATVAVGAADVASPITCTITNAAPNASVTKSVTSATRDGSGLWTIVYDVVVSNTGDGVALLDVNDALQFGGGVTINSVVAATATPGVTPRAAFNGTTDTLIAPGVTVFANTSRTFTVTVTARIDAPQPGQGACDPEGTEAGGFLNTVTLRSARTGDVIDSAFACAPFSTLTLVKNLVNNSGGTGTLADFVLTAVANGVTHVQGTGTVTAAVPAGTYTLAETAKAGYASSGFSCSTGETGSSVTVPVAFAVTCTITNDDAPVADLAIVKSASVPQIGAGGGFTWLLDVTNNGPDPAVGVVINDIVPGQVTVTGVTSAQFSCSNSGNTVTCTKASMAVGETGAISIAVTVPAAAANGTVTNIGTVTATTPDNNTSNNSDDASVTVVAQAPPPPPTPPPVILPPTGSNSTTPVTWAAISLVLIGGMVMLVSRRRRDHTSVD